MIALSVTVARATILYAQSPTNAIRLTPTNSIASAHAPYQGDNFWRLAPNTPAFEEYGVNLMLSKANELRAKWNLDIPNTLAIQDIIFWIKPTAFGIYGDLETRDYRFDWGFNWGVLYSFQDHKYWPRSFRYHDEESAKLATIKSKIDAKQAEAIARHALHKLGLTEKQLRLVEPPLVNQYKFEETNGVVYPQPMFNVGWRVEEAVMPDEPYVVFDISGITKNVAQYINPLTPRVPIPTNYLQLLDLPTNYLETLSPKERFRLYLPPLTNSLRQVTNSLK